MERPAWVDQLSQAYAHRAKNVIALTGNVRDIFQSRTSGEFLPMEQLLYQELNAKFLMVRVDAATGIDFFTDKDRQDLRHTLKTYDEIKSSTDKIGDAAGMIEMSREAPLAMLAALRSFSEVVTKLRSSKGTGIRPLCIIAQFAGSIFPAGGFDRLGELDRQRLVSLLRWIDDPLWQNGDNLLILVNDTRAELNGRIFSHPGTQQIEVDLPNEGDRLRLLEKRGAGVSFEPSPQAFIGQSAGLKLTQIEDLIKVAKASAQPITRANVLAEVNAVLEAELGDIIKISVPNHGPDDVIGNEAVQEILKGIFDDCENPETAVAGILVSGPNGGGKTHTMEAFASVSGRIVIELTGLRGSYYGETDKFFEMLLSRIKVFGKILILVDEAHTAFGSVHKSDVHETERRLAGNLIKMMGNPSLLGKVVWALMTSRPDELDPDVKSRCSEQISIFDAEGEDRPKIVSALFKRKKIEFADSELPEILKQTETFSMRDFGFLIRKTLAKKKSVLEVLRSWKASGAIVRQRRFQSLVALQHCSYPQIVPPSLQQLAPEAIESEAQQLRFELGL